MLSSLFPLLYATVLFVLLLQAFRVMAKGYSSANSPNKSKYDPQNSSEDRTGRLTIHPELLDQDGRITDEELLTVRFSGDNEPPHPPNPPA